MTKNVYYKLKLFYETYILFSEFYKDDKNLMLSAIIDDDGYESF